MENGSIVEQDIWDKGYQQYTLSISQNQRENAFLERFLPARQGSALEIGCFPGRYLPLVGRKGYTLSGIDRTPRVAELPSWLTGLGCKVGKFYQADFCAWQAESRYDAVISFGFVEHFTNWDEIFVKHCSLVAPGGVLLVTFPNFGGMAQKYLHAWLDAQNLSLHWQEAMRIARYREICARQGFEIVFSGYWGGFDFWLGGEAKLSRLQQLCFKVLCKLSRHGASLPSFSWSAPYCGIVAKRV